MGTVTYLFRSGLRTRWRSWLVIIVLITLVSGFVMAAAAAGRRTDTAFPRFVATYGYDAAVFATGPEPALSKLPEVRTLVELVNPVNAQPTCDCSDPINDGDFSVYDEPAGAPPVYKLVAGRRPDPSDPDEVLASLSLQRDNGVQVGTVIRVPFYSPAQAAAANAAIGAGPTPLGPTMAFHVTGIVADQLDFPSSADPSYNLYTTPAFGGSVAPRTASGPVYLVRLRQGQAGLTQFEAKVDASVGGGLEGVSDLSGQEQSIEASIHPQAIGWWILAGLGGLVGLIVVVQALGRQASLEREDYPTLRALGADRRKLFLLGTVRTGVLALVGAVGAVALATALSPLTPVGEARVAEPSTGLAFDVPVDISGVVVTVLVVVLLGLWPAWRAARGPIPDGGKSAVDSGTVERLAAVGTPPTVLIGVRRALPRRQGRAGAPVGAALLGTVLAVTALTGSAVFGASLNTLTRTPALYGTEYQIGFGEVPGIPLGGLQSTLDSDRAVTGVTQGIRTQVSIGGSSVGALAVAPLRGPLLFTAVTGRPPTAPGEIGLGAGTMRQVGARLGSVVMVTFPTPSGAGRTVPMRVVGQIPLSSIAGTVSLGNGALVTLPGYLAAACPPGPTESACRQSAVSSNLSSLLVSVVPGDAGRAAVARYADEYQNFVILPAAPTSLVNFGEAINFPLLFGLTVALFGAATLTHLLVVTVVRRRRETGLLKVLGFVNGQVAATFYWQSTTAALVGLLFGLPLGIIVGRSVWLVFAERLGAVPVAVVPLWLIAWLAIGVLVAANLLAAVPALVAARSKPAQMMRTV